MDKSDFHYKRKPAFMSFLLLYILCFGIAYVLIDYSPYISKVFKGQLIGKPGIQHARFFRYLPYGILLAIPFAFYGTRKLLWNLMSIYEMNSSEIRLLTGSLSRKEHFFLISDFYNISFTQNLIETPFGIGCIILNASTGGRLIIKGVYNVKSVVEALRPGLCARF
ncbi:MAG: hypothetical protein KAJ34_03505 [Thermodesulfovibrionia bacterium]|nr:hypothetical protein [Thermodesulfovibrionia bacterium]